MELGSYGGLDLLCQLLFTLNSFIYCFEEEGSMRPFWREKWKKNAIEQWQPKAKKH
ncbi:unnamed protein product [Brassica oleracea]